ncbi:MAG TPA: polysaccharide biosynthesis/export family protein [Bdellovibrionota bacterium]|nr:polysaccharide biosynthesis/export family protein [Bdellovibrionota bacterium]
MSIIRTNRNLRALAFFAIAFCGGLLASENDYRVGIGDVLDVKVLGEAEFSGNFRVGTDGKIDYPYLRKIEVKGKTTEELGKMLTERLRDGYLADPQVNVEVRDYQSQRVMVLGAVKNPGTYVLKEETKVLDLISKAGGIAAEGGKRILLLKGALKNSSQKQAPAESNKKTGETGDQVPAVVVKEALSSPSIKPTVIDYYRLVHEGDFTENLVLEDGDILNVPKANEIFVLGNVARPGPVKYEDNLSILQAVTLAGGPTPEASTKSTYILRQEEKGETKINVRLDRILKNEEKNVMLKADDVIVVPESFF